ncbi:relaxase/mobilization nuclease domain-containing protein [Flavobacterium granuli]|uniref:Relaxase/Mobilisation nuclease domain-containing protein n=1 Tax=Flavobacterium granuli TaxID=280093 RepID=A0A1M5RSK4_9FLAO|nr:relaxase/mobilization nuclease domain-containing protein [Flavobacterium granuli]PRZ22762.1 relaxase/mobilization nuclease-like protein [Flavobacterium granuli]SHH29267.1 Relaxase/Mobilisation nuclease domain-containing protein [Flavobacterium granuli]
MVAIIKTGHSIHRILNYNENKVQQGVAECIGAGNYPVDIEKMGFTMKLNRLLKQANLNENVKRNSVHISLNFDVRETEILKEKLMEIADTYMGKIGFKEQPYLVYQHHDAGHPHIHIISLKVRADGSRIDMQNIGRNQSEKARKEIETAYGLIRAEKHKREKELIVKPVDASKVEYGRSESKRAITNVLDKVLQNYKYASLPELNAVLQQYNVTADRGSENSRIFQNRGLLYRILDEKGKAVGVPIKASDFYSHPTLKFLEERFIENEKARTPYKSRIKNTIDMTLLDKKRMSIQELKKTVALSGINMVFRQNGEGLIYGITYVDHQTQCVFNGSALGKLYSAKAIQERCGLNKMALQKASVFKNEKPQGATTQKNSKEVFLASSFTDSLKNSAAKPAIEIGKLVNTFMQSEQDSAYLPNELKAKKKKKKRKGQSDNQ